MKWPWRRHVNGSAEIRKRAEAGRDAAKKITPIVAKRSVELAHLTDDEFAARVARAFRRAT